ncbi:MAG: hypothetical protein ACRCYR_07975 [Phycicoccus sp.]
MPQQYEISQSSATTAVQAFDQNAADIKAAMNQGYAACQSALSNYRGAQADMFWRILGQIQAEMQNISKELDQQGQLVHSASARYTGGDTEVASLYQGVGGSIGTALG